jgi:hypothetical protein
MSLVTITSPLSAIAPRVWWDGPRLCARTSLFWQGVSLGAWRREVVVDPDDRAVWITTRRFWVSTDEVRVAFDSISHIEYRYGGLTTGWNAFGQAHDGLESFSVALALHDRSEIPLFSFQGEGSHATGATGVLLGDSLVDVRGDQQEQSLSFIDSLQQLTGKGLSRFSKGRRYR